jgi:hypothetical protein
MLWPKDGVTIKFSEGARIVLTIHQSTIGTTTVETIVPLMQLPVVTSRGATATCIDDLAVGVSLGGVLLYNNTAFSYVTYNENEQIGYARDGFPIYGVTTDIEGLDECGGKQTLNGYRYYLRDNDKDILKCYGGTPARFLE